MFSDHSPSRSQQARELQPILRTGNQASPKRARAHYSALDVEEEAEDEAEDEAEEEAQEEAEIFNLDDSSSVRDKVHMIVSCSLPIIFTFLLSVFGPSIMMFFAGRMGKQTGDADIFAGVSLALTYCNISFLSIMEGFSSAVETLSSNFNGSKNYQAVGLTLHKSVISLTVVALPLLITWFFVEHVFLSLGVSPVLADISSQFLRARIFAAPVEICMISYVKYLQSMGLMLPGMYSGLCYNVVLAVLCYLSVHVWGGTFVSLAWCHVFSVLIQCILLVQISLHRKEVQRTLVVPSRDSVYAVGEFLLFGFSGCVMTCAEWWAFELLTIFASMVSAQALSAQTVMLQAITILFMFPLGIGISTGAIVGNALGAGHKQLAISIGYLSMLVIFLIDLVLCPLILQFRLEFVELFTSDLAVIHTCVVQCFPLLAVEIFIDGAQAVSCGVLRGAGKQTLGAAVNLGAYYLIALPVAYYLCFSLDYEVLGLMIGVCVGVFVQTSTLCCVIVCKGSYVFEGLAIHKPSSHDEERGMKANEDPVKSPKTTSSHAIHHLGSPRRRTLSMDGVST